MWINTSQNVTCISVVYTFFYKKYRKICTSVALLFTSCRISLGIMDMDNYCIGKDPCVLCWNRWKNILCGHNFFPGFRVHPSSYTECFMILAGNPLILHLSIDFTMTNINFNLNIYRIWDFLMNNIHSFIDSIFSCYCPMKSCELTWHKNIKTSTVSLKIL